MSPLKCHIRNRRRNLGITYNVDDYDENREDDANSQVLGSCWRGIMDHNEQELGICKVSSALDRQETITYREQ